MKIVVKDYLTNEIACIIDDETIVEDEYGEPYNMMNVTTFGNFYSEKYHLRSQPMYRLYQDGRAILEPNNFMIDLSDDFDDEGDDFDGEDNYK